MACVSDTDQIQTKSFPKKFNKKSSLNGRRELSTVRKIAAASNKTTKKNEIEVFTFSRALGKHNHDMRLGCGNHLLK